MDRIPTRDSAVLLAAKPAPADETPERPGELLPDGVAASLLADLPAAVLVVSADGSCWANRRARAVLGRLPDPAELARIFGLEPGVATETARSPQRVFRRGDGKVVTLGYRVEPLAGGAGGHIVLFQDISDVVLLREERDRYLKIASLISSVATFAHEIKNPLAAIRCLLEVLEEETTQPAHLRDLKTALAEAARLAALIDSFGSLAGADGGEPFDAAAVAREAAAVTGRRAEKRHIELAVHLPETLAVTAPVLSPDLLALATRHLLANALEASAAGGRIDMLLESAGKHFRLVVSDRGTGMDREAASRAPEPFFSTKPGASGIGLTLVQEVAHRCGGKLILESEPSCGTRVELTFPHGGPAAVDLVAPEQQSERSAEPSRP